MGSRIQKTPAWQERVIVCHWLWRWALETRLGGRKCFHLLSGCAITNAAGFAWILPRVLLWPPTCCPPDWLTHLSPTCLQKLVFTRACLAASSFGCFAVHDTQ